jgi:phytoene synthase
MSSSTPTTFARVLAAPRRLVGAAGSNFYYSFLLLPKAKRRAITEVYRFARLLDDIVDEDPKGRDPFAELPGAMKSSSSIAAHRPRNSATV